MQLQTFGNWTGSISGIGAGALTASPDYQYLAPYLAAASAAVWVGMLVLFLFSNRREIRSGIVKLGSWYFILPCVALAVLAIAGAAYGFGLRAIPPAAAPTSTAGTAAPPKQSKVEFIKGVSLTSEAARPLVLTGRIALTRNKLRIFVDYSYSTGGYWQPRVRVPIGEINEPVKGEYVDRQLVFQIVKDGAGNELWIGDADLNYPIPRPGPVTQALITFVRMRVVILDSTGEEQHSYFEIVRPWPRVGGEALTVFPLEDWVANWQAAE